MVPSNAQVSTNEKQEIPHSVTDSVKNYVTVMSWEHKRELYIADGMSEASADSMISAGIAEIHHSGLMVGLTPNHLPLKT
jgi:hypothetical protein